MFDDEDLATLLAPSHQLTDAPMWDPSPISRDLELTGELNPVDKGRMALQNGQYLSGVDAMVQPSENIVERDEHAEIFDMERQDDVLGSGVFDPYHRGGTANRNTGVFASKASLPGYLAREVPFTVSREVTDLTDGAAVVTVPAGGMAYVERDGHLTDMRYQGQQPAQPQLRPAPPTTRDQPYVDLSPTRPVGWDVDSLLHHADGGSYNVPPATSTPGPAPRAPVPAYSGFGQTPVGWPPGRLEREPMFHVKQLPQTPVARAVRWAPQAARLSARSMVSPMVASLAFGQDPAAPKTSTATWVAYGVAGVAVGAALRMLFVGGKGK